MVFVLLEPTQTLSPWNVNITQFYKKFFWNIFITKFASLVHSQFWKHVTNSEEQGEPCYQYISTNITKIYWEDSFRLRNKKILINMGRKRKHPFLFLIMAFKIKLQLKGKFWILSDRSTFWKNMILCMLTTTNLKAILYYSNSYFWHVSYTWSIHIYMNCLKFIR